MLRWLIVLALFVVAPAASAQPACWPDIPVKITKVEVTAPERGSLVYSASSIGLVYGWACTASDGKWHKIVVGGPWSSFVVDWLYVADKAMRGTPAERDALWNQYNPLAQPIDARLKPDLDAIMAVLPNPPAPSVWKVMPDPFRSDRKRPIYHVANGKRGASTGRYIDAGEPCSDVTKIAEFGAVYFLSVEGNPGTVARCVSP